MEILKESPIAGLAKYEASGRARKTFVGDSANLPIVAAHGMGDSCFNDGMKQITAEAGEEMGGAFLPPFAPSSTACGNHA